VPGPACREWEIICAGSRSSGSPWRRYLDYESEFHHSCPAKRDWRGPFPRARRLFDIPRPVELTSQNGSCTSTRHSLNRPSSPAKRQGTRLEPVLSRPAARPRLARDDRYRERRQGRAPSHLRDVPVRALATGWANMLVAIGGHCRLLLPYQKIDCTGRRARDTHNHRDSASSPQLNRNRAQHRLFTRLPASR
jgi:hypothetical protein